MKFLALSFLLAFGFNTQAKVIDCAKSRQAKKAYQQCLLNLNSSYANCVKRCQQSSSGRVPDLCEDTICGGIYNDGESLCSVYKKDMLPSSVCPR